MTLHYTQASAGSGKTTSIERDVADKLEQGTLKPTEIMAVTFTKDAAAELKGRISQALLKRGNPLLATGVMTARIGTVHSVFGQLLTDFAFELGLSPEQRVLDDQDKYLVLAEALDSSLSIEEIQQINSLGLRLSIEDWRKDILGIVELMRSNNLSPEQLGEFSDHSIETLNSQLPGVDSTVSEQTFRSAVENAITSARSLPKPTKGVTTSIKTCESILRRSWFTWQDWVKVSKLKPTKMGAPIFAEAMALGLDVLKCPAFRDELAHFIRLIFSAAKTVMHEFSAIKQARGLVDFVDQEQLALTALDQPAVQKRINEDIRYLIVDEFQDTSPIQLALFSKMSELVDDVLMVGDAKQAIYGFRGSDPKLALDVLNYVQQGGGNISTLPDSWRSRPGLVALSNELFTAPFNHLLTADQVQLNPQCSYKLASAELGWWTLEYTDRKSNDKVMSALAEGIREHIQSEVEVWDKKSKAPRIASWRDLAVLCRGNAEAAALAGCCARIGIPVSLERSGLVETPEISLALACLRRLVDPSDSLASAEILTLSTGKGPEIWLKERLESVENNSAYEWNDSAHPILQNLASARQHIGMLSTKEALDLAMLAADVTGVVTQWQEGAKLTEHRLANLAKLSELVDDYENHCQSQSFAATPAGFLLWLKDLEQNFTDKQASNPGDAITIATYHAAKGLEWPIVVCNSLDSPLKVSLYGTRVVEEQGLPFDWGNPLNGRSICYWPNPFPDQKGKEVLSEALSQSHEWATAERQAINEAIQLLYVGITRARDQLILTTIGEEDVVGNWLALINNSQLPPTSDILELPSAAKLNVESKKLIMPDELTSINRTRTRHWLTKQEENYDFEHRPYYQPASSEAAIKGATCKTVHDFGTRIGINGSVDMERLGTVLHHCLALGLCKPDIEVEVMEGLINAQIPGKLEASQVINRGRELIDWVETHYPGAILHTEFPFTQQFPDGGVRQGAIDLAVETSDGWLIVDHKSNPQPADKWHSIALEYSGQLAAYSDALETLSGKKVLAMLVHFSVSGGLVEVLIPDSDMSS